MGSVEEVTRALERVTRALERVGLNVTVLQATCPPNAYCVPGITDLSPAVGTVVPVGSNVTISLVTP